MAIFKPNTIEEAIAAVRQSGRILPVGGRTKNGLCLTQDTCNHIDLRAMARVVEYEPTEFTVTATAGTSLKVLQELLAENRQCLPFDPPFSGSGATLGGAISSGLNGSSSLRFGGARDFILGVRWIDGTGEHVFAGGKVVKNAAGFDLPKFFVGSCGRFGVLTEITLKVFPRPTRYATLLFSGNRSQRVAYLKKIDSSPLEIEAIDLTEDGLMVRLGGAEKTVITMQKRIEALVDEVPAELLLDDSEASYWRDVGEFLWAESATLIKVPCLIDQLDTLHAMVQDNGLKSRVSLAGQVMYIAMAKETSDPSASQASNLGAKLNHQGFPYQCFRTESAVEFPLPPAPHTGDSKFSRHIKLALDPKGRFAG